MATATRTRTRTPRLTPARAAHLFFRHFRRSHPGTTTITFLNNGGRSKLMPFGHDGQTAHLAPSMHRNIATGWEAAAVEYAKAVYGARKNWPASIVIDVPTEPLTYEDAAPHLGDHVLNNRIYTFSAEGADAAHRVVSLRERLKTSEVRRMAYRQAIREVRLYVDFTAVGRQPEKDGDVFRLALSYVRRNPR